MSRSARPGKILERSKLDTCCKPAPQVAKKADRIINMDNIVRFELGIRVDKIFAKESFIKIFKTLYWVVLNRASLGHPLTDKTEARNDRHAN